MSSTMLPKTPTRHRARSETKTPLTPSLMAGINSMSISHASAKPRSKSKSTRGGGADVSNPFIVAPKSRPSSPVKKVGGMSITEELSRQANAGVIRKGGIESRIDVITMDYIPPKIGMKKSRSSPALVKEHRDRFITTHDREPHLEISALLEQTTLNASPGHTARLAEATGISLNRRVLGFHEPPPVAALDPTFALQREWAKPLYARQAPLGSSTGSTTNKSRKIPTQPDRVLDAPGLQDDFYLNLLSWSCMNSLAVALEGGNYVWNADTGSITQLGDPSDDYRITSLDFSNDGMFLGMGVQDGSVELWDVETGTKLRTMTGHQDKVVSLSWYQHILSSGCNDGSIWHHDVRVPRHKVTELLGHNGVVCGLKWRPDGELIASGGNDNVVNIWDGRVGDVAEGSGRRTPKWTKRNHTAAVKALAWCPWQNNLLASGGGTNDGTINVWNTTTGARLHSQTTPSQITTLHWAPHKKEIFSTHGYPTNSIMLHAYPSMERVAEIRDAHTARPLFSCVSPAGDVVCTGASDENLKFWKLWEITPDSQKKRKEYDTGAARRMNTTNATALAIR